MPGEDRPAGTLPRDQAREVPRPVADERGRFLPEGGHHHLARLPLGHGLERLRVQDLQDVVVGPVVDPLWWMQSRPVPGP